MTQQAASPQSDDLPPEGKEGKNAQSLTAPVKATPEILDAVISRLSLGETLSAICRDQDMPSRTAVHQWRKQIEGFASRYAQAREAGMGAMADEIIEIADDDTLDEVEKVGRNGSRYTAVDHENINRSRLRIDTRKWLMARIAPHLYGDRLETVHTGTVTHEHQLSDEERVRRLALFMLQGGEQAGMTIDQPSPQPSAQPAPSHEADE